MWNEFYLHVMRIFEWKKLLQRISHMISTNIGSAASFIKGLPIDELIIKITFTTIIDSPLKSSVLDAVHSIVNYKIYTWIVQLETSKFGASNTQPQIDKIITMHKRWRKENSKDKKLYEHQLKHWYRRKDQQQYTLAS